MHFTFTVFLFIRVSLNPNITLRTLRSSILGGFVVADTVNDVTCNLDVHGTHLRYIICLIVCLECLFTFYTFHRSCINQARNT